MPRENPSVVYIVKGEGVRDNSWELQPPRPIVYSNPPVEQLDSVPTPLGSDLSIRIFEKGTNPVPNFFPSATPVPPATSVVAAQATPVAPAITPAKTAPKSPSLPAASVSGARPSSALSAPAPSKKASMEVVPAKPAATAPKPSPRNPQRPSISRRLRNFRRLSTPIIANPNIMPGGKSATPTITTLSSKQQASPLRPITLKPSARAISTPTPAVTVPSTARPGPRAPVSPTVPVRTSQGKVHISPPKVTQGKPQGAPSLPHLAIPGPASPLKAMRTQPQITSPSAFGRWKTSAQVTLTEQRSPQLPSPTKHRPVAVPEKARAQPWEKVKAASGTSNTSFDAQKKAMDSIIAKARAHQQKPKAATVLPPLTPLSPPAPRPSQAGPVSPATAPSVVRAEPPSKRVSSSPEKPGTLVKPIQKESESARDVPQRRPRPFQKPAQQHPAVDTRKEVKKDAAPTTHVKPPAVHPSSPRETTRKAPVPATSMAGQQSERPKLADRKLLQKEAQKPGNVVSRVISSSAGPSAGPSSKDAARKPGVTAKPSESRSLKSHVQPVESSTDLRPAASPRTSIDGYEIGTAARPIVTKEDLLMARRKRDVAATAASKSPPSDEPGQSKGPLSGVRTEKEQRATPALAGPSTPKAPAKTGSKDLFNSEIQESMKSVVEQILWTVRHYKRRYGISHHDEMKSNKKKILRFIQTHLEEAAVGPKGDSTIQRPLAPPRVSAEADAATKLQSTFKGREPPKRKEDSRHMDLKEIKTYEMFKGWRKHLEEGGRSLQRLATEASQLRETVLNSDPKTVYFSVPGLLIRLGELGEPAFTISELNKRLKVTGKEIALRKGSDSQLSREFQDAFNVIKSTVHWVSFLSEQVTRTRGKLRESRKDLENFLKDIYGFVTSTRTAPTDETPALVGIVTAMRAVKSTLGKLEREMKLPGDGESLSGVIQDTVRTLADVCKEGQKFAEQGVGSKGAASSGAADRSEAVSRRPRHEERPESHQEPQSPRRRAPGPGSSSALQSSATQKHAFEPRGRARAPNGSSAATTAPRIPTDAKSLPVVPRRPPNAEPTVSVPVSQAGPSTQRSASQAGPSTQKSSAASGSISRWLNVDRPNLRTLMESARTVDQIRDDRTKDSAQAGTKRRAEDESDQKKSDSDTTKPPSKKRRVKFAPVLVQGEQNTPYSKEALSSLFFDGFDILSNACELQRKAVEERSSQLSRGSVIATFGFIRSYIAALKAEKEGRNCDRPVWVKLPYTPAMKGEVLRLKRGNGLRSAPGPS